MNITLNPEQFLAVYNSLGQDTSVEAQEVKNKMNAVIVEALSTVDDSSNQNKFTTWFSNEKKKVQNLQSQLNIIKEPLSGDGLFARPESK